LASDLARIKGLKQCSLIFTGALVAGHRQGGAGSAYHSAAEKIMHRVVTQSITFAEAERQVLGFDHIQVGAMVADKWHFPDSLQCIIKYYHTPLKAKGCFSEASIVHLADAMCRKMEIGLGVDSRPILKMSGLPYH
jgi:HD-like signal output (HDOD) protein